MTTGEAGKPGGPGGAGGAGGAGGDGASNGYSTMDRWNKVVVWVLVIVIILLAAVAFQITTRNNAIADIRTASQRIELAALHTEQVLVEVVEQSDTPEAEAQRQAIARALADIAAMKALLCSLPELAEADECP